jgi:hypothetical protein
MIPPGSLAAKDSCSMMGRRQFAQNYHDSEHVLQNHEITDPVDITCRQEYTKYMSLLDHHVPAIMGGRNNGWREIQIAKFPPHRLFYNLTSVKRSLVKNTIKEIYNSRKKTEYTIRLPKLRNEIHSASSVKKIKLQKILAIYGMDDKTKNLQKEPRREVTGQEDADEREFETLFEWANDLDEEEDLLSMADYKHQIDYIY